MSFLDNSYLCKYKNCCILYAQIAHIPIMDQDPVHVNN